MNDFEIIFMYILSTKTNFIKFKFSENKELHELDINCEGME
jgi:hypothetical protein